MKNLKNYLKLWPLSPRFKTVMILGSLFMILGIGYHPVYYSARQRKGLASNCIFRFLHAGWFVYYAVQHAFRDVSDGFNFS